MDGKFDNLDKMRQGVDTRFPLKMRGFQCLFRPLSIYETNVVAAEVVQEMSQKPKSQQNAIMENSLLSIKILEKASSSDIDKTDYAITSMELQRLSPKEIEFLYAEYVSVTEKVNPRLDKLSREQIKELIEDAKKKEGGLESALMTLSFWEVWNIALSCLTPDEQPTGK